LRGKWHRVSRLCAEGWARVIYFVAARDPTSPGAGVGGNVELGERLELFGA